MEKLMIFIDGENLFRASKDENIQVSFKKLIRFLSEGFNLIRVYYYTGIPTLDTWNKSKESESDLIECLERMKDNGKRVIYKSPSRDNRIDEIKKG